MLMLKQLVREEKQNCFSTIFFFFLILEKPCNFVEKKYIKKSTKYELYEMNGYRYGLWVGILHFMVYYCDTLNKKITKSISNNKLYTNMQHEALSDFVVFFLFFY